ncbi:flagellar hook-associated protein FlgK [Rossellomorea sp. BNER]|uniref:flagellar hook-associated protein FlgK n=1 Tax=Rossellomorea sp. BNER TaxID=2962031 RepID=UPI003AF1E352|nr:flagellar hook-associated protein FlgK [Rossellomorea sp. BNER]
MRSTFHGLETAKRGMFTQQGALYTTGHNIANANTPGYSRQRVNFQTTEPYPGVGMNRPQIPGQIGSGVEAGSVQRIREKFLDIQFRGELNKLGYWETKMSAMEKMEEVMNEPSDSGLSKSMDMFWQSLQDLAVNPTNPGARSVVRERGIAVTKTFSYLSNSLKGIQEDLKNELSVTEKQVNSLLNQIHKLNNQIADVEPHGYLPNDLYDERDRLIDELSGIVDIQVSYESNGGSSLDIAEGRASIFLSYGEGSRASQLVGKNGVNEMKVQYHEEEGLVSGIKVGKQEVDYTDFGSQGKLRGLVDSFGYVKQNPVDGTYTVEGSYPNMLKELDNIAYEFVKAFNEQHKQGVTLTEMTTEGFDPENLPDPYTPNTPNFFIDQSTADGSLGDKKGFAGRIDISDEIKESTDNIASASAANPTAGNASNILALADVIDKKELPLGDYDATFKGHYESVIGQMAVESQEAVRLAKNSAVLTNAVETRRMSVSGVSLDEEMTNMIKFQHAYNASARMITLQDELLDKIINGMGTVGR